MDIVPKMIQDIEEIYHMSLKENNCFDYACNKLREEYNISENSDEERTLKQLVFKIILGSMLVREETRLVEHYSMKIRKMLREYKESKEKLHTYYSDNDIGQIEGMINSIGACKDKMYTVKKMIMSIEDDYGMYLKENRGIQYVFIRLWDECEMSGYPNEEPMLKMLVYNIIIANMNLKEEAGIVADNDMNIRQTIRNYEKYKEKLRIYYDDNDMELIEGMVDFIYIQKDIWVRKKRQPYGKSLGYLIDGIIIAVRSLEKKNITDADKLEIQSLMKDYEEYKERLKEYYSQFLCYDIEFIEKLAERIYTQKDKWDE